VPPFHPTRNPSRQSIAVKIAYPFGTDLMKTLLRYLFSCLLAPTLAILAQASGSLQPEFTPNRPLPLSIAK
jgi:hypothetical protein